MAAPLQGRIRPEDGVDLAPVVERRVPAAEEVESSQRIRGERGIVFQAAQELGP